MNSRSLVVVLLVAGSARADVFTLLPAVDAFVAASHPASNYGGGGSLAIAAAGLPAGEFQSLFRFDTSGAAAAFDASLGVGRWEIVSVTLQLNSTPPTNPLFNAAAAGQFGASWMEHDDWTEGAGTPNMPGMTGVVFSDLPALIGPGDQELGVFDFDGATSGATVRTLALAPGLLTDLHAGSLLSLRLYPIGASVAYLVNSRSFQTPANRPVLTMTAGPAEPACYANCDGSTTPPVLNVLDFGCFLNRFAAGDPAANCDGSTTIPALNVLDFGCFLNRFAAGCS